MPVRLSCGNNAEIIVADQLEEIKSKINIVDLISEFVPLKKAGRNFKGLCPFHSEKTPSFIVSPERQIFKCFGCNAGGDVFKFLMLQEKMDFGEALRTLAKRAGVKLHRYRPSAAEKRQELLYEINHLAGEFYHYLLLHHPVGKKGLGYILGRGITKKSLQLFKLGFAPNAWDSLQKFLVGKKGYRAEDLEQAGLVIKSEKGRGFYDRFRGRLMFPLRDHRGNVAGFAGRTLDSQQEAAKYINTPETVIYHKSDLLYGLTETKEAIKKADQAVLVEGELDVISSYQAGVEHVVAIKGSALTPNQVRLLSRFTKNIIFALDRDLAGDRAARRGVEVADAVEMSVRVVQLEGPPAGGKDPDEVAQADPQLWWRLVKKAVPVYDYLLDSAFSRFDDQAAEGKRKIGQELVPILAKIGNEIVRAHYVEKLAKKLAVPEEAIVREVNKVVESDEKTATQGTKSAGQSTFSPGATESLSRREMLEGHLLALCFQSDNWRQLRGRKLTSLVKTPRFIRILEALAQYLKRYKTISSQRLAKILPVELRETFDQFYLLDLAGLTSDEEKLKRELNGALAQLEKLEVKDSLKVISGEIRNLEEKRQLAQADKKMLDLLYQKFRDLSRQLSQLEAGD